MNRPRPTVNDVAREAGVSLATVDRVLNARPGVRAATVARVERAIDVLGYVRDVSAANLARRRHYRLACFLPDGDGQFVDALERALLDAGSASPTDRTDVRVLRTPADDAHALVRALDGLAPDTLDGVAVMAPETPQLRDAVTRLTDADVAVVALVSDLPTSTRHHFVGIDNLAAGRTAASLIGRFVGRPDDGAPCRVQVLVGSTQARDSVERRLGFDSLMAERFPHIEVLPSIEGHDDRETIERIVGAALHARDGIRAVYSLAGGHRALTTALERRGLAEQLIVVAHELTPHARLSLANGHFDAVITQNLGHVARSALRVLRALSDRVPIDAAQEDIRIEIVLRENLPALDTARQESLS